MRQKRRNGEGISAEYRVGVMVKGRKPTDADV